MAWRVLLVVQEALPLAAVYLTRVVVHSLVAGLRSHGEWPHMRQGLLNAGLMGVTLLLAEVIKAVSQWIRGAQSELVQDYIVGLIHGKAISLDTAFFEPLDYYDQLHRAQVESINRPLLLLENFGTLVQNAISLAAMAAVLARYTAWLPVLLVAGTLPAAAVVGRAAFRLNRWRLRNMLNERRVGYYDLLLTLHESVAELRLFRLGKHYSDRYQALRARLRAERLFLSRKEMLGEIVASCAAMISGGVAVGWMALQAIQGAATLGSITLFCQVVNQGQNLMRTLLSNTGEIYSSVLCPLRTSSSS